MDLLRVEKLQPDYPSPDADIAPKVDEFRIVGPTAGSAGITSIRAGDGVVSSTDITVTIDVPIPGLDVDTAITVEGISSDGYNGDFVVEEIISPTEFTYNVSGAPLNPLPPTANTVSGTVSLEINTVNSSSPYIFQRQFEICVGHEWHALPMEIKQVDSVRWLWPNLRVFHFKKIIMHS